MSDSNAANDKSFWGHLDDLRKVLFRMVVVLVVFMAGFFFCMPWIFDHVILAPCNGDFVLYRLFARITSGIPGLSQFSTADFHVDLINIRLTTQFFTHLSATFWLSLVCAFPVLLYLLWGFIRPALYEREARGARAAFCFGALMFYVGAAVSYFLVFPITLRFLYSYELSTAIHNTLSLDSYMSTFVSMTLVMGVVFELPLLAWVLSAVGVLRRPFFRRYRRHAIVILLIVAAIITPTSDPFTLSIVFFPLYLLYEFSALLVKKE